METFKWWKSIGFLEGLAEMNMDSRSAEKDICASNEFTWEFRGVVLRHEPV